MHISDFNKMFQIEYLGGKLEPYYSRFQDEERFSKKTIEDELSNNSKYRDYYYKKVESFVNKHSNFLTTVITGAEFEIFSYSINLINNTLEFGLINAYKTFYLSDRDNEGNYEMYCAANIVFSLNPKHLDKIKKLKPGSKIHIDFKFKNKELHTNSKSYTKYDYYNIFCDIINLKFNSFLGFKF